MRCFNGAKKRERSAASYEEEGQQEYDPGWVSHYQISPDQIILRFYSCFINQPGNQFLDVRFEYECVFSSERNRAIRE
jgi:hypothetical protein